VICSEAAIQVSRFRFDCDVRGVHSSAGWALSRKSLARSDGRSIEATTLRRQLRLDAAEPRIGGSQDTIGMDFMSMRDTGDRGGDPAKLPALYRIDLKVKMVLPQRFELWTSPLPINRYFSISRCFTKIFFEGHQITELILDR
jgi:hypothetical protein